CSTPKKTLFDDNFVEMKSPAIGKFLVEAVEPPMICESPSAIDRRRIFGRETSSSNLPMSPMSFSPKNLLTKQIIHQNAPTSLMNKQPMKRNSLVPKKLSLDEINVRKNFLKRDNPHLNKFRKCHSKVETVKKYLDEEDENANLIADFSAPYILPLIEGGKQSDLKAISHDTLSDVLLGKYDDCMNSFTIIDCRYPYEYNGGHIIGAKNFYTKDSIFNEFISSNINLSSTNKEKNILIFYCEFSSERGPKMCRYLRNEDREWNQENYPRLFHPEIYLLENGYKEFFNNHRGLCEPSSYKPMLHEDNADDLIRYKAESKMYVDRFEKRSNSRVLSR
ncbi:hypothetical protein HELRODRAFT_122766, partial [Helobdella robusta]|uniref:M-phase inducer phosphatase n=1 Tax=Helobdella robusta TaxID=6412 RepID=T1EGV7_HELRO